MPRPQRIATVAVIFPMLLALCAFVLAPIRAYGQASVLTHHNDVARTGQNLNETMLTPANVNASSFGKLFVQKVDGSIVGQPLYVPNVQFPNGTTHNVVYVATQHDSVFAFDADNNIGANANPLWTVNYPKSIPDTSEYYGCGTPGYTEIGIMGTPVIDPTTNTLYVVSKTLVSGQYFFNLHALDITSGAEKFGGPVAINATVQTGSTTITFTPSIQLQRPALLLLNGAVYIGFGSNGCDTFSYHGWLLSYSASTLQQLGVFISTPGGTQGALWGSGGGPAADSEGYIYVPTANGTFDFSSGGTDFGDSILKLNTVQNGFNVLDYFTPYNQATLDQDDLDLGSGGVVVLPDDPTAPAHELLGGGKQGTLYLVDRDDLGEYNPLTDMVLQEFPGITPSIKTVPAYWNGNVYLAGQKDYIKMFTLTSGVLSGAPVQQTSVLFNDRGPSISVSANGSSDGILWAMLHGTPVLYAFDATNLSNELYDTTQALKLRDRILSTSRFVVPTVVNGKVYVGGLTELYVFGLLPGLSVSAGNNQSGGVGTVLPVPLTVQATDTYSQTGIPGVTVTCADPGFGGKFNPTSGKTDGSGNFSTNFTLGTKVQAATVTCTATGYASAVFTETTVPGPPNAVKQVSGNQQTAPVETALPQPLVALVVDAHSNPIPGVAVTFNDGGKGGTFPNNPAITDAYGHATTSYTTSGSAGTVKITADAGSIKPASFTATVVAPTGISITSGNYQSAAAGTQLPQVLTVLVTDKHNNPVAGINVTFSDGGAGGTFSSPNPVVTGTNGTATQSYTLPTLVSSVTITATATGLSQTAVFSESAVVGPAAKISVTSGNNQSGTVATKLAQALIVVVADQYNNPVSGINVSFSDGGAGGAFSNPNPVTTGSNGTASQSYTLPTLASSITITATATGVSSPATFAETSVAGSATGIAITSGNNQAASAGMQLPQALTVVVTDQYNNPVSGVSVAFSDGGAGGAFANPNPGVTNSSGTVSQSYTLPIAAGTITITATATGVANPAVFAESSVPGPPAIVAIVSGNNQSAAAGTQLSQALTVVVTDQFGNAEPNVSVTFSDGGAGGTFYNPNPGTTGANGMVSQTYLLPTTAGTVTITATAAGVANSATFTETSAAGNPANIAITGGNNQTAPNGTQLPQALTVLVTDQYNNPVVGASVTFSDGGAGGTFSNSNPVFTVANGTASQFYTLPAIPNETITITATAAGVNTPAVFTEYGQ
jgi:protocatechuate 3,4-dioxygenase beta subunit